MAPRFFAPAARSGIDVVELPDAEAHHLRHVLRLGAGAEVSVFDGRGGEWAGRVAPAARRARVRVERLQAVVPVAEPSIEVTLGIGLLKGDQMDAVVRDATALGVAAIAPLVCEHVVVSGRARRPDLAVARWHRIAIASARQCGRAVVPAIAPVRTIDSLLDEARSGAGILCVEPARQGARTVSAPALDRPARALAVVGPEGGWSEREIDRAVAAGMLLVHLGPRTLRAETAPTVLLSALWTVWGW
jgi:16S rRNA (uracil1498-N3)-methyltransferase